MLHIYKTYKALIFIFIAVTVVQSCNIINPKEKVPTYIHIDSFQFTGHGSHEITAAVVYYNNNPVGTFDLPATFPVQATDSGQLLVTPCINSNGQNDRLVQYPFYRQDTFTFTAQPGKIINCTPKTDYVSAAKFTVICDFEYGKNNFSKAGGNVYLLDVTDPSLIFEGNGTGSVLLTAAGDSSVDSSQIFPVSLGEAFIEFDYKTEVPFALGMLPQYSSIDVGTQTYIAGVNPSNGLWRKFYLNITGYLSDHPAPNYNFFIKTSLPAGQGPSRLLIDNIKLVTF